MTAGNTLGKTMYEIKGVRVRPGLVGKTCNEAKEYVYSSVMPILASDHCDQDMTAYSNMLQLAQPESLLAAGPPG